MIMKNALVASTLALVLAVSGCAATPETDINATGIDCGTTVEEIAVKAKEEGKVDLIALPDSWANYAGVLSTFKSKYCGLHSSLSSQNSVAFFL